MEAANLAAFLKFGETKNRTNVLFLQKKSWVATKQRGGAAAKLGGAVPSARA